MKYDCRSYFLNFYQVINAIPKTLVFRAHNLEVRLKENYLGNYMTIKLAEHVEIDLQKAKAKYFYWLLNKKVYQPFPTGPAKWNNNMNLNSIEWGNFFK